MPFDPSKPLENTPVDAAEMRGQLTGLNDLISLNFTNATNYTNGVIAGTSANTNAVALLNLTVSDPPTQAEVQTIADKLDELITTQRR